MSEHPEGLSDRLLDIFRMRQYFNAIVTARQLGELARQDARFVEQVRRALFPFPGEKWPVHRGPVFTPSGRRRRHRWAGKRVAVAASGGSGAAAAVVGVVQALGEAGVEPALLSLCSGSAFFGLAIAAGRSPEHVARFIAMLTPPDYLDFNWRDIAGFAAHAGRGFGGLVRGERVEEVFRPFVGDMTLAELRIPAYFPAWNVEENRLDFVGPRTHPDLPLVRAIRTAIAIPLFIDPVPFEGHNWCDGGIVDILPVAPILDMRERYDVVVVVNSFYPREFAGESERGWRNKDWSILHIANQVKTNQHVQLAREHLERLRREVPEVVVLDPVPYSRVRGARFYSEFIDPRRWPRNMRDGRSAMVTALEAAPIHRLAATA